MRKVLYTLFTSIFVLLAFSCTSLRPIEIIQLKNLEITEFKGSSLTLKADIEINNPNPLAIKVVNTNCDLKINNRVIGHLTQMDKLNLEAKSQKAYPVIANFEITSLKNGLISLMQLVNRRDAQITISGSITGKTLFVHKTFDFNDVKIYQ